MLDLGYSPQTARLATGGGSVGQFAGGDLGEVGMTVLRPVGASDFKEAMRKLKASVSDNSRELQKVIEWNEKYGEVKRRNGKGRRGAGAAPLSIYV